MDLLALAAQAHVTLLNVALAAAAGVLLFSGVLAVALVAGRGVAPVAPALLDWLVVGTIVSVAAAGILGLPLFAGTGGPRDGLHVVYGIVALLALPLARSMGAGSPPDPADEPRPASSAGRPREELTAREAAWLAGGSIITLGVLFRLSSTG
jgi:hypothetical protein